MLKHDKIINILSKIAADIHNPVMTHARHAAAVVIKGEIISVGINERKSHPFQAKYAKNPLSIYLHAETSAIHNSLKYTSLSDLKRASLYVVRMKSSPSHKLIPGLSKPCCGCQRCIATFGLRRTIYTLDGGGIEICDGTT